MANEFGEAAQADMRTALVAFEPGLPIAVVAASNDHALLLDNWFCHIDAIGMHRVLVVAMDRDIAARLSGIHFPVVEAGYDGSITDFWFQRARIWKFLVEEGVEFIHSDTDAVWLRDPIEEYAGTQFDLLVSQGTVHPTEALIAWGFVLCCGFFWLRPTAPSRRVAAALIEPSAVVGGYNDQATLNRFLVAAGTHWMTRDVPCYQLRGRLGRNFTCYCKPVAGYSGSLDLRLLLLPQHLFPRVPPGSPEARVRHMLREANQSLEARIDAMRASECWRLDKYPNGYLISH